VQHRLVAPQAVELGARAIFYSRSRLRVFLEGKFVEIEFEKYMDIVGGRSSPRSLRAERVDQLTSIQQSTSTTAFIVVSLPLAGKSYTDHLSLIKDDEPWQIISKVYHLSHQ
jgi:hypothetical protein